MATQTTSNMTSIVAEMLINEIKSGVKEILAQMDHGFADAHHDVLVNRSINIPLALLIPLAFFLAGFVSFRKLRNAFHNLACHRVP
ncbi:hypothetical protein BKA64DRAFT_710045 [Cadophora sp. MPI-SDFR-AT-0126]|nr:hypothetical protein BKA64DRAFT_710045 [Leotiomycetes sp. MPI-SDFR-AT-0126]